MLKIRAFKYVDCENIVLCNRAGWDENHKRLPGSSLSPTRLPLRRGTSRREPWGQGWN